MGDGMGGLHKCRLHCFFVFYLHPVLTTKSTYTMYTENQQSTAYFLTPFHKGQICANFRIFGHKLLEKSQGLIKNK